MKNKITFPGIFLLVWAIPFFCSGQTGEPEKMSEKEKEACMKVKLDDRYFHIDKDGHEVKNE